MSGPRSSRPWPEGTAPTPAQLAEWLRHAFTHELEDFATHARRAFDRSGRCLQRDHDTLELMLLGADRDAGPRQRPTTLNGTRVVPTPMLPYEPSPAELARRIVRHGYASARLEGMRTSVLEWATGETDPGPAPEERTHAIAAVDPAFGAGGAPLWFVSPELHEKMRRLDGAVGWIREHTR